MECRRIHLRASGQVQGVGFRPFVYRLADELNLTGWVVNDPRGVTLEVQGMSRAVDAFPRRLRAELPPLASIARLDVADMETVAGEKLFEIRPSEGGELADAQITVDTAVCDDCLREMRDPADPRFAYPFINCTNCGPRYTIVERIPYDRPNTTMAEFPMCPLCERQYAAPADRRFHAQPVACPTCGPKVYLADPAGEPIDCDEPIAAAANLLEAGRIVAIKGLGGFHLACRGDDEPAVRRLRERKRRDAKPFALMVRDLAAADMLCELTDEARDLLAGPLRPIVLLPKRPAADAAIAPSVACSLSSLGIMLPYTPLHHLLFDHMDAPLVMTSANVSDEPLVKDNDAAVTELGALADALLMHDRRIARRLDDSVVQLNGLGGLSVIRRARGFAPQPIRLRLHAGAGPSVLGVGAELKSSICLYRSSMAMLGEHIGDLKESRTYRHFVDTIRHLEELFEVRPDVIACDLHPQYLSSLYAARRARGEVAGCPGAKLVRVQHHHAHAAACLAENNHPGPALAIVADGVGYGDDGAVWGCEIFRCDLASYERLGHLRYIRLPGGDKAAKQTFRPALAGLYYALGDDCLDHPIFDRLAQRGLAHEGDGLGSGSLLAAEVPVPAVCLEETLDLLRAEINAPLSSSLGRWFDAAAAIAGVATGNDFEGRAPMMLEAAIVPGVDDAYPFAIDDAGEPFLIDLRPMVLAMADDAVAGTASGILAARFHNTVAAFLRAGAGVARQKTGLAAVALSGGCFMNRYLLAKLVGQLREDGFEVLIHKEVPTNDGCVALGQAVVAGAKTAGGR